MPERIDQPTSPPSPAPCPTSPPPGAILSGPNTPQQCHAEYDQAADVRRIMDRQDARARR